MKKNILVSLVLFLVFLLNGCGSTSKTGGTTQSTVAVEMQPSKIALETNGTDFSLPLSFIKLLDSSYHVELSDFQLSVTGCTVQTVGFDPATLVLDGGLNTQETLLVTGAFDQNCTPTGFTLTATQKVTKDGQSKTEEVTFSSTSSGDIPAGGYGLINATTPITIATPNQIEEISVYLVDERNIGISGKTMTISTPEFGSFSSSTAITNGAGKVAFSYQAPEELQDGSSTIVTIYFDDETENIHLSQEIQINVNLSTQASEYNLTNIDPMPVDVAYPAEQKEVKVQLTKNGGEIVAGATVYVKSIPVAFGRFLSASSKTDASGYATFTYVAADSLTDGTQPFELYYDDDSNGVRISAFGEIEVSASTVPFDYNLTNLTTPIIITHANQAEDIEIYLVDKNHVGVVGKTLTISTIANGYGEVTSATAVTNAAGKATFHYSAPGDISSIDGTDATMTISFTDSDTTISDIVTVRIASEATTSTYALQNASTPIVITSPDQNKTIDVQLVNNNLPVIDARPCTTDNTITKDCVIPEAMPREYGRILNANGSTEPDGYVYYDYLSAKAEELADVNGTSHTFNIYYIDVNGKVAAETNVTIEINLP